MFPSQDFALKSWAHIVKARIGFIEDSLIFVSKL
jgi:hypothetical protein